MGSEHKEFILEVCVDGYIKDYFACGNCEQIHHTLPVDRWLPSHPSYEYDSEGDAIRLCDKCGSKMAPDGNTEPDVHISDVYGRVEGKDTYIYSWREFNQARKVREAQEVIIKHHRRITNG